jgi:transcriptional regulator with XRE-family HTH domain
MNVVSNSIKKLREEKGMTQDELAEKLYVTRQTVSNYENGKSRPDVEMLTRIAETLETDPNTVLYGLPVPQDRKRMLRKLWIALGCLVLLWVGYSLLRDKAFEIANLDYRMELSFVCVILLGPGVLFATGWTGMQVLGVLARLTPFGKPWDKRLRCIVLGTVIAYLVLVLPVFGLLGNSQINLGRVWYNLAYFITGYWTGLYVRPNIVLFFLLGCALWLGMPEKKS